MNRRIFFGGLLRAIAVGAVVAMRWRTTPEVITPGASRGIHPLYSNKFKRVVHAEIPTLDFESFEKTIACGEKPFQIQDDHGRIFTVAPIKSCWQCTHGVHWAYGDTPMASYYKWLKFFDEPNTPHENITLTVDGKSFDVVKRGPVWRCSHTSRQDVWGYGKSPMEALGAWQRHYTFVENLHETLPS